MKHFLLLFLFSFSWISAQHLGTTPRFKQTGGENFLERLVVNPTLPDVDITAVDGKKSTLLQYISRNRTKKAKPFLLVSTYTFCGGCLDIFTALGEAGLPEKYDVLVVVELTDKELTDEKKGDYLKRAKVADVAKKYNLVFAKQEEFGARYNSKATPMFIFTDAQLRPYYSYTSWSVETAKKQVLEILRLGEEKLAQRTKVWLDDEFFPVEAGTGEATYYYAIEERGNRGKLTMGGKSHIQKTENYVVTEDLLIKDGKSLTNHVAPDEKGGIIISPHMEVTYKMGRPTHAYKSFHSNGKVAEDYPLNGPYKAYDEKGQLTAEGTIKNGLGDGEFTYYKDKTVSSKKTFKDGKVVL